LIGLCFTRMPDLAPARRAARAAQIVAATKLPAKAWVKGILASGAK
jgi:hypothetical protein